MKKYAAIASLVFVAALGCNSDSKDSVTAKAQDSPSVDTAQLATTATPANSDTKPSAPTDATKPADATPPKDVAKAPDSAPATAPGELPALLKHDAYEYEGLANSKPIDMELVIDKGAKVITGSQSITFKGLKDGVATYNIDRTGGLSALGSEVASLEKDGVYTSSSSVATLSSHAMELPAHPKPGMTWHFHISSDKVDSSMDMETVCTVVGLKPVTTKVATYKDALLVEQDSKGTLRGEKVRTVSRNWYVKGIGTVKADLTTYMPNGKSQSLTIQETKHS